MLITKLMIIYHGGEKFMFKHDKQLLHEVRIDAPNPNYTII